MSRTQPSFLPVVRHSFARPQADASAAAAEDGDDGAARQPLHFDGPRLLRGADIGLGPCVDKWNLDYLNERLGPDASIVIHESSHAKLSFLDKNFAYKQCKFNDFAQKLIAPTDPPTHVYLRSTHTDPRANRAARIEADFPGLAEDLTPSSCVPFGPNSELYHSSVLRIASRGVAVWTHFDLYDNVLCQTFGSKRVVLAPPQDSRYLYTRGDKSLVDDFEDLEQFPLVARASLYRCTLAPGDVLFIPALWWHNIRTCQHDHASHSIGFNIFWRDPELARCGQYAANDVYGNRSPPAYEAALGNLNKALAHLDKLPAKYAHFYRHMLLKRLENKLHHQ